MDYITISEFLQKHLNQKYKLNFFWQTYCKKCYKIKLEKDDEYSEITFSEYDKDQYEWAFDLLINEKEVKGNIIEYIEEDTEENYICAECRQKEYDFDDV